ncbi:proton-conducting transporter transmembrane domain-containing protein [Desulfolithobacter sp.]
MDAATLGGSSALIQGHSAEALHVLCTLIFVFCGLKALFHNELKKVLIYSFVGLVVDIRSLLTLDSSLALASFFYHVFNFILVTGMMLLVASLLRRQAGSGFLKDMRGIGRVVPLTAIPLGAGLFAMMGLPPFSTFFSKVLMVYAFVDSGKIVSSVLLAAGEILYFLVFLRVIRVIFFERYRERGHLPEEASKNDLKWPYVLLALSVVGGFLPQVAVLPFFWLAGALGSPVSGNPVMAISWNLPVLILVAGAGAVWFVGRKSNRIAGLLSAGVCLLAMTVMCTTDAGPYGTGFAYLVLFMGALQFTYSVSYMEHSHSQFRFYVFFLLMVSGLLGVSLSQDLFSMFFFWEIMSGWIMYLALAHEGDSFSVQEAGKYFTFNYFGAALLTVAVTIMYKEIGTWDFAVMAGMFQYTETTAVAVGLLTLGFLMKAAQLPFRIDYQMHPKPAPTPISGYISSTVLKSGPFMMVKIFFIAAAGVTVTNFLSLGLVQHISGWIGALTIVLAASFAMLTNSMKRLLIFHTVSQLGYVVVGCSLMTSLGLAGGLLHFVNHMFFKNLLFLCAGAVFIATGTDKMDKLGGLARKMPVTFFCFMVGVLAISGVPMFSGFVSKWMIYHAVMDSGFIGIAILSLFGSVLTLASFIKFMHSAYLGQIQDTVQDAKEASWFMLVPMMILAGLSVVLGIFPGLALEFINLILVQFSMEPLVTGLSLIDHGVGGINMLYVAIMLLSAIAAVYAVYLFTKVKTRSTHVYACGVQDLSSKDSHVASVNFYEDSKAVIKGMVRLSKRIIGVKGDYVER